MADPAAVPREFRDWVRQELEALRVELLARKQLAVEELFNTAAAVALDGARRLVDTATVALPERWGSMDVMLVGAVEFTQASTGDHRVSAGLESPDGTLIGADRAGYIFGTAVYPNEGITVPLSAIRLGLAANMGVRLEAEITGGSTALGDVNASDRYLMALKVRTA